MEAFCHAAPFGHLLTTLQAGNGSAQSDLLQDTDLQREPVKEPARKWFNWWRANIDLNVEGRTTTIFVKAGSTYVEGPFPSRDIAVSAARDADTSACGEHATEYLGAFPEGERP